MRAFVAPDKSRIVRTNSKVLMSGPHKYVASEKQSKMLTSHPSPESDPQFISRVTPTKQF